MRMEIIIRDILEMERRMVRGSLSMQHQGIHIQVHLERIKEQDRE